MDSQNMFRTIHYNYKFYFQSEEEHPIYGVETADGVDVPFGDLYLDMFPEFYDVE